MSRRLLLFVYPTLRDVTTLLGINDAFAWCCDDKFTGANFRLDVPLSLSQPGMYRIEASVRSLSDSSLERKDTRNVHYWKINQS